ncbi:hypothetical protein QQS21_004126 [Conoideocrella luteorostrata]|uniref:FAD dependent oxidoreductase n=1 Tax=Conoideocrella luteorostrata TaxID=1105319 RepID=A0AAJ0CS17_9HYPO|nr:hypothetical protein QQS21_004126 [Conoideocrella luteorostrata]
MRLLTCACLWANLACLVSHALPEEQPIEVDVAIVGGGATGAYAAVRLREDYKKSVLVIEKTKRLGGHVHAYYPTKGHPVNYGVQAYLNRETTKAFFKRFNLNLIEPDLGSYIDLILLTKNVDFNTGRSVFVHYGPVDIVGVPVDLIRYLDFAIKYQPFFENGYFHHGDVPEDLLLPFGKFLAKYDLQGALGILRNLLWLSDAVNTPTWTVMAVVGAPQIAAFGLGLTGPSFTWPETRSSETLFDRVLNLLSRNVLLESTVIASKRTDRGVTLTVQTPSGRKTVKAKKLLIAATPSPENVGPWDLSNTEKELFSKFSWETLFVGVVNNTGLHPSVTGIRNAPENPADFFLPQGDFTDAYTRAGSDEMPDLWTARVIGRTGLTDNQARNLILQPFKKMKEAGTFKIAAPSLVEFASHGSTVPKVSAADLKAGFYNRLYALQGQRSTFWTGLTWAPDYTPILWDFTEKLFPEILKGL